ncbi:cytochrome P450 [Paecilomyces variotii No. 5]|uniref:Cytochrome P450 n=1 Tax=Byssochlamys spectabilis (strain No. 5 / NBRC 109023) TaxID=1356009 RepID=V5FXG5_BYSSN|nr:cytochrome P450 [Paecilomyces variotii No. 5]
MHNAVGSQAVRNYRGFQDSEGKILMRDLLEDPDSYVMSIERYSCSVVSIVGWGRRIANKDDYVVQRALDFMERVVDIIVPGAYWMESLPLLAELPRWLYALPKGAQAKEQNFAKSLLSQRSELGLCDKEIAGLTTNLIGGGVDTTSSSMISCILTMCVFSEVRRKAHEELDAVIGSERFPGWDDEEKLPYIQALVKETLRWRSVTVLGGIPHAPIQDDIYQEYYIPAGTNITGDLWAIHRNPKNFPDPDVFRPERYLNGLERPYPNTRGHNAFGWGRRQCSGQPLAEQGLMHTIAQSLWAFEIKPGLDENGNAVRLDIFAYTNGENIRPVPFKARFIPRSEKARETILFNAEKAREELKIFDGETKLTLADAVK